MPNQYIYCLLCVFVHTLALPAPKKPFALWPTLITAPPKSPSVPPLKDLKQHLQNLTKNRPILNLELLNKLGENNLKCEDNIVELDAEEENINEEIAVEEIHAEEVERSKETADIANNVEAIPTFIPIFRPKYVPVANTEVDNDKNDLTQNNNEKMNLVVQYMKNQAGRQPLVGIGETQNNNGTEVSLRYTDITNTIPKDGVLSNNDTSDNVSITPYTVLTNSVPTSDTPSNTASLNGNPTNFVILNGNPINTQTYNDKINLNNDRTISIAFNNIPMKTGDAKQRINVAHSSNIADNAKNTLYYVINSNPKRIMKDTVPVNAIPFETINLNGPSMNPKVVSNNPLCQMPCQNPIVTQVPNRECQDLSKSSTLSNSKGDIVLFKPETVSVMNVYGDLMKKLTMTVLVPMTVAKLT